MTASNVTSRVPDHVNDPEEVAEWAASFDQLLAARGPQQARTILQMLGQRASAAGIAAAETVTTDYVNTISVDRRAEVPR